MKRGGKTVKGKYIEDVWSLVCSIKRNEEDSQVSAADSAFKSAVLSDINSLKSSVTEIKFDLHVLQTAGASQSQVKSNPCFIYVCVKLSDPTPLEQLD